jgi:hypothetical protein
VLRDVRERDPRETPFCVTPVILPPALEISWCGPRRAPPPEPAASGVSGCIQIQCQLRQGQTQLAGGMSSYSRFVFPNTRHGRTCPLLCEAWELCFNARRAERNHNNNCSMHVTTTARYGVLTSGCGVPPDGTVACPMAGAFPGRHRMHTVLPGRNCDVCDVLSEPFGALSNAPSSLGAERERAHRAEPGDHHAGAHRTGERGSELSVFEGGGLPKPVRKTM